MHHPVADQRVLTMALGRWSRRGRSGVRPETALGATTVPLPIAAPGPIDCAGLDSGAVLDHRAGREIGLGRNAGLAGQRFGDGGGGVEQSAHQSESLLRPRRDQDGNAFRHLLEGVLGAQHGCRPLSLEQVGVFCPSTKISMPSPPEVADAMPLTSTAAVAGSSNWAPVSDAISAAEYRRAGTKKSRVCHLNLLFRAGGARKQGAA